MTQARRTLAIACLFVSLSGCGASDATKPGESGGESTKPASTPKTLVYSRGEDAATLDPIHTDVGETVKVLIQIYETLVAYDEETVDLVPGLATKWEVSDDGLIWKFSLREGVVFHDGTPFDADAVVFSFERLIQPGHKHAFEEDGLPYRSHFSMIEKVEATGPLEATFTLKRPSAIFLKNIVMFPASVVSPTAVKKHGRAFNENPSGTGPFQLKKWRRDRSLALGAFERHWRGRPAIDNVVFVPVRESSTRVDQLKRGEAHIADDLPPAELDELAKRPDIKVQETTVLNVAYLAMQTEKKPLDNVKVRQAIALAIDKKDYVQVVYGGYAEPATTLVPKAMWGHDAELEDRELDVDGAKRLLAEGLKEAGHEGPLSLSLSVMAQPRPYIQRPLEAAGFLKDSLRGIGIEVEVQRRDVNQHFDHLQEGKHELCLAGWSSDNTDPDNFLYSLLDSDNVSDYTADPPRPGNNLSWWRNQEAHELMTAAQSELDESKRFEMYRRVQRLCFDEAPVVPLAYSRVRCAQRANVTGFRLHPTNLLRLRTVDLVN